jgi:hypothetical protein
MRKATVEFVAELKKSTSVPWPHNVCRHAFISNHLVKFESAAKTALEAGNTEQKIFDNCRELVAPPGRSRPKKLHEKLKMLGP